MDWKKIRREYLAGGVSYRQLAAKYGISETTIGRRSRKEGWVDKRGQTERKVASKVADAIADKRAAADTAVFDSAVDLIEAIKNGVAAVCAEGALMSRNAKEYAEALRNLQQVLDAKPTELDVEEQKARIAKLRHDVERESMSAAPIEIIVQGGDDGYGD